MYHDIRGIRDVRVKECDKEYLILGNIASRTLKKNYLHSNKHLSLHIRI